jgi:hypothetical protein
MRHLAAVNSYVQRRSQKTRTEHLMRDIYFLLGWHEILHSSEPEVPSRHHCSVYLPLTDPQAEERSVPCYLGSRSEDHGADSRLLRAASKAGQLTTPRSQAFKALQSPVSPGTVEHRANPALRSKSVSYRSPSSGRLGKGRSQSVNLPSVFHTDPKPLPVLNEHLDPFLRLATSLSHRDRNMLQFGKSRAALRFEHSNN